MPRAWAEKDPVAGRRLQHAREAMAQLSEQHHLPQENLLTPDTLRRVLWTPPPTRDAGDLLDQVVDRLGDLGARSWQVALTAPLITTAILEAEREPEPDPEPDAEPEGQGEGVEVGRDESEAPGSSGDSGVSVGDSGT